MALLSIESQRLSNLVKSEYDIARAYCRDVVTVNDTAGTLAVGTVLGKVISGGTATAVADAGNTGTGAMGTITVTAPAQIGAYRLVITAAATDAGTFIVTDPNGVPLSTGTVGAAYSDGGLAFTLADATDYVVGDAFTINVSGSYKYKRAVETATDGSKVAAAVVLTETAIAGSTDTKVLVLVKGPASINKAGLVMDATYNTDAEKAAVYAALEAKGIQVLDSASE